MMTVAEPYEYTNDDKIVPFKRTNCMIVNYVSRQLLFKRNSMCCSPGSCPASKHLCCLGTQLHELALTQKLTEKARQ